MKRVDIKTGFICNNNCLFCVQADNKCQGNRSFEDIKKDLIEAKKRCEGVVFTGGEVTIRKDFFELLKLAKKLNYKVIQIQTNGRMFSSKNFCLKTIQAGATEFAPAIHGYCAEQHDFLTKAKGSFNQVTQGIKNLKELGTKIITNTVVVKQNYKDISKIAKLLVELKVNQFQLAFVHGMGNALTNFDLVVPTYKEASPYIIEGLKIGIEAGIFVMAEAVPLCYLPGYEKYASEYFIPDTEIRGKDFQNTNDFTKLRKTKGKMKFPQCVKCVHFNVCEGPWIDYFEKKGSEEFKPVKQK
jgi:MoaA/NifB/PqqE/SkfB family radical SAM enzyme